MTVREHRSQLEAGLVGARAIWRVSLRNGVWAPEAQGARMVRAKCVILRWGEMGFYIAAGRRSKLDDLLYYLCILDLLSCGFDDLKLVLLYHLLLG